MYKVINLRIINKIRSIPKSYIENVPMTSSSDLEDENCFICQIFNVITIELIADTLIGTSFEISLSPLRATSNSTGA
jgi:hypothetical protein